VGEKLSRPSPRNRPGARERSARAGRGPILFVGLV
jgi:hypothetical protein